MADSKKILVSSDNDIIQARMQVRQMARHSGFSIEDQARISMATSSLAHALSIGKVYPGYIEISRVNGRQREGLKVACATGVAVDYQPILSDLKSGEWSLMVDELSISLLPGNGLRVVVVKWL